MLTIRFVSLNFLITIKTILMKTNFLILHFLLLIFVVQMQGQLTLPNTPSHDPTGNNCTDLVNVVQECEDDGTVTLTFLVLNGSNFDVNYIYITDGNGWSVGIPTNLTPQAISTQTITYTGAVPESIVCFTIKLYNPRIGLCCFNTVCINVIECPCGAVETIDITCVPGNPNTYLYCFEVSNAANSNNTIDQITVFTNTPDICLNGTPIPTTLPIAPIPPGSSDIVCVTLTGCNAPLPSDTDIDFTFFLEDSGDPAYCCHMDTIVVTTPDCCDNGLDCSKFQLHAKGRSMTPNFFTVLDGISEVTTTLSFRFLTEYNPDQLFVFVNGSLVLNSGAWSSFGSIEPACLAPQQGEYVGQVSVEPCDEIYIFVHGDTEDCGTVWWDLFVNCGLPEFDEGDGSLMLRTTSGNEEKGHLNSQSPLTVFPNPVSNILNIQVADADINYESVLVMDHSGRTVLTESLSGRTELQLDTQSIPSGTYIIEIIDKTGNRTVEKFMKLD